MPIINNTERYQKALNQAQKRGKHQKTKVVLTQTEASLQTGVDLFGNPINIRIVSNQTDPDFLKTGKQD